MSARAAIEAAGFSEGFDEIGFLEGAGWLMQNNSDPPGYAPAPWLQGSIDEFNAYDGAPTSYVASTYNETYPVGTISSWLVTPLLTFDGASTLTFYTRSGGIEEPDRLQVRLCSGPDCSDVGTAATDLGDFSDLLLDINPNYDVGGYPSDWTLQTISGLPTSGTGRIAFRYFVEDSGLGGTHGDYVAIDRVTISSGSDDAGLPSVAQRFGPKTTRVGARTTLVLQLQNAATTDATLTAPFTETLPEGMTIASPVYALTSCGGTAAVTTDAGSVTLSSGTTIPAGGACTLAVDAVAAAAGSYVNSIDAGALVTDAGTSVNVSSSTLTVTDDASSNGVIAFDSIYYDVQDNSTGMSLNMLTGETDDTGDLIDSDVTFFYEDETGHLMVFGENEYDSRVVVDADGNVPVLHEGDEVGVGSTFSLGAASPMAEEWLAGTDGYVGVRTNCSDRLMVPVPDVVCYGYVHLVTSASGYPATVTASKVEGDGNPIAIAATSAPPEEIFADGFDGASP